MMTTSNIHQTEKIIRHLHAVPYDVSRHTLYCASDLYAGFDRHDAASRKTCFDSKVYHHFLVTGKQAIQVEESLARSLHDHGMHAALHEFFKTHDERSCVGIMGGHALLRTDDMYRKIALLSKSLTEHGCCMLSGGGPGAMEATHLGAWMAGRTPEELDQALNILSQAPSFKEDTWLNTAFKVMEQFPQHHYESLSIPTWLYGHEPSTPFATHIAKFFENSIREDSIVTLAYGGIIYTPGSAGTVQEIFSDAVQNHYLSLGLSSPMIFMGKDFWTNEMPIYPLLQQLMSFGKYKNLILSLYDDEDEIIEELMKFRKSSHPSLTSHP